jgi:transcriptional regulator with XRE-family HTH domain
MQNPNKPNVGATIKALRKNRGLVQSDFNSIGISSAYLSLIETGQRKPSADVLKRLAEYLEVDITALTDSESDELSSTDRERSFAFNLALRQGAINRAEEILALIATTSRNTIFYQILEASFDCEKGNFVSAYETLSELVTTRFGAASLSQKMEIVTLYAEASDRVDSGLTALLELYRIQATYKLDSNEFDILVACLIAARLSNAGDTAGALAQINTATKLLGAKPSGAVMRNIFWTASNVSLDSGNYEMAAQQAVSALLTLKGQGSSISNLDINLLEIETEAPSTTDEKLLDMLLFVQSNLVLLEASPDDSPYIAKLSVLEIKILIRLQKYDEAKTKIDLSNKFEQMTIEDSNNIEILGAKIEFKSGNRDVCRKKMMNLAQSLRAQAFSRKTQQIWGELKNLAITLDDLDLLRHIVEIEISKQSQLHNLN